MIRSDGSNMVARICGICTGKRKKGSTDFIKHMDEGTLIIKNVPVEICDKCGEKFYSLKVARRIEEIVNAYREMMSKMPPKEITAREIDFFAPNVAEVSA